MVAQDRDGYLRGKWDKEIDENMLHLGGNKASSKSFLARCHVHQPYYQKKLLTIQNILILATKVAQCCETTDHSNKSL